MTSPLDPSPAGDEALLLQVVLAHADNVEALLAAEIVRREALERDLIAAKEAAEAANRAKGLLLAKVNHDLRTPLTAILGFAAVVARLPGLPEQAVRWLGMIRRAGEHLNQLIDDLLDMSRIEVGKVELERHPVDLRGLLEEVAELNRAQAGARRLELRLAAEGDALPGRVLADGKRLRRILNNLLGNAIKFTRQGWVGLRAEALPGATGPGLARLRFEVADSGPGVPPAEAGRLFSPFEQGESEARSKGLGLGLAISRELVELMGGRIELESEVGVGTRFWFDLELPLPPDGSPPPSAEAPPPPRDGGAAGGAITPAGARPPSILVVDDEPDTLELLTAQLQAVGLETLVARDGPEALDSSRRHQPDLILLDVHLPGWNGFETCRRLKHQADTLAIPVIFLSGSNSLDYRLEGFRAGGVDYIGKPFAEPEVLARVTVHLATRRLYEAALTGGGAVPPVDAPGSPFGADLGLAFRARDLLLERLADPPSLHDLALAAGTNQTTLNHAFQRYFGLTAFEYLREQRLIRAQRMLRETRQAVKVVALEVGYRNSRDFSRAFKARLGITPQDYRRLPAD